MYSFFGVRWSATVGSSLVALYFMHVLPFQARLDTSVIPATQVISPILHLLHRAATHLLPAQQAHMPVSVSIFISCM